MSHNWIVNSSENIFLFDYQIYDTFFYADMVVLSDPYEYASIQIDDIWYILELPSETKGQVSALLMKASLPIFKKILPKTT
jgi:hypothetical protein